MSCKAFFSGKSPYITLRLGKCLIKVRIHCLLDLNKISIFFNEVCNFPQIVQSIGCDLRSNVQNRTIAY